MFELSLGDMYRGNEGEEEPEWVKNEKEQFSLYRDKDRDGYLNTDEVGNSRADLWCSFNCSKMRD